MRVRIEYLGEESDFLGDPDTLAVGDVLDFGGQLVRIYRRRFVMEERSSGFLGAERTGLQAAELVFSASPFDPD